MTEDQQIWTNSLLNLVELTRRDGFDCLDVKVIESAKYYDLYNLKQLIDRELKVRFKQ